MQIWYVSNSVSKVSICKDRIDFLVNYGLWKGEYINEQISLYHLQENKITQFTTIWFFLLIIFQPPPCSCFLTLWRFSSYYSQNMPITNIHITHPLSLALYSSAWPMATEFVMVQGEALEEGTSLPSSTQTTYHDVWDCEDLEEEFEVCLCTSNLDLLHIKYIP